jgi:hypothetical protein
MKIEKLKCNYKKKIEKTLLLFEIKATFAVHHI